ncbi:phosphate ABC transporter substrate-binding protein [Propionivibrio soli]|uniref:phosphate ABC transporter substrate-binding protein n=1 Tax=Propionivibrio soli TaxID=2976531 RepID=UPI0021E7B7A6|nr:phosphate ABC transporter substrate-binding protein [Propionivibrio soli]
MNGMNWMGRESAAALRTVSRMGRLAASAACIALYCSAATGAGLDAFAGKKGTLDIAGGTAHIPVMKEAAKRIMQANPEIRITVGAGGSGVGVQKVGEGLIHIGNTGRPLSDEEIAKYGLKSFAFAIDGVAAAVHPKNPVSNLTPAQVQDIFAGKITNWKTVGGADAAIHLYTRDEASGTREVFWEKLLKKGSIVEAANVVASNGAMKSAVSGDPGAIGYVSIGHIDETIKAPTLDGVAPTQDNARSGKYPIVRNLYMNTKGAPQGLTAAFIDYIMGPEGVKITADAGYLPLSR